MGKDFSALLFQPHLKFPTIQIGNGGPDYERNIGGGIFCPQIRGKDKQFLKRKVKGGVRGLKTDFCDFPIWDG